jgi:hypothetical protein
MVNIGTAKLAGVIMVLGMLAIAGTNLAFAQNATSTPTTPTGTVEYPCAATPFHGGQAYGYIACTDLGTAQWEGLAIVGGVVAFSIGCAAGFGNLRH